MVRYNTLYAAIVLALMAIGLVGYAIAAPTGVGVDVTSSVKSNTGNAGGGVVYAEAGNMTILSINATAASESWQGYYGNVSGNFTLETGTGATAGILYRWPLGTVTGEIYASRQFDVSWTAVACANATLIAVEENALNMVANSGENISDTFSTTKHHPSFDVGTLNVSDDAACFTAHTFVNNASQSGTAVVFPQVALNDDSENLYYAVLLNNSATGFDGRAWDFQMLVPEDGHDGDTTVTAYYFWAELG